MEQVNFGRPEMDALVRHFDALARYVPLAPIRSSETYETAVRALNGLLDAGAGEEDHPLAPLLVILGERIAAYDDGHHSLSDAAPAQALALLMEQHGLRQGDLPEIGSQGVVSEILNGRRALNIRQIKRLAERFQVNPATFL